MSLTLVKWWGIHSNAPKIVRQNQFNLLSIVISSLITAGLLESGRPLDAENKLNGIKGKVNLTKSRYWLADTGHR